MRCDTFDAVHVHDWLFTITTAAREAAVLQGGQVVCTGSINRDYCIFVFHRV